MCYMYCNLKRGEARYVAVTVLLDDNIRDEHLSNIQSADLEA